MLRTSAWGPAGLATADSTVLPPAATTLESLALADSTAAAAIVTESTGTGAAQRYGTDVLERPAVATPWAEQSVRTGLAEPVGSPQLAMNALGAFAMWVEGNVIVESGTDHALPRVLAIAKPKKIGIGVLGPYSLRASDTWSPIADVTWSYGDGTTERGTSVRHAYSHAGSFHVTVTVHDAAGNAAQRTFVVVATPLASATDGDCDGARPERGRGLHAIEPERHRHRERRDPGREDRAVPLQRAGQGHGARTGDGQAREARRRARHGAGSRRPAAPAGLDAPDAIDDGSRPYSGRAADPRQRAGVVGQPRARL